MTTTNLLEIAAQYRQIADVLQDAEVDEQTLRDTLEGEAWPMEVKANNYCIVIRNLEANVLAIESVEQRLAARRKTMENRIRFLRDRLRLAMEIAGVKTISCPLFSISLQMNQVAVDAFEPALIPEDYMRQPDPPPPQIDKVAIKNAIENGIDVPGARLTRSTRLVIR